MNKKEDISTLNYELKYSNHWRLKIESINISYSSLMESHVLFCYPCKVEMERVEMVMGKGAICLCLYSDSEQIIDKMLDNLYETGILDLAEYYEEDVYEGEF
ncbi:hypothetical protein [Parasporobacterium paucivorans]|uniref:Uncharacterized protein n=1 Tax=Parasporobacterium paucivorans DSM 15970 TaxID=1122934 RepID=A0A1M6HWS5_9FIRM|nr:hypothetical protein [Parasporobacterium paucivorans]SHJ26534.1 hypothetical protein SAMN02745691_01627 [Parasporobacterium paucivorans DSM 15970]